MIPGVDEDAFFAALDLVGRSGASSTEFGWLHDDVPIEDAGWWATAHYRGTRLTVDGHRGPVAAIEALARRILTGGQCAHCRKLVALNDGYVWASNVTLLDGRKWSKEDQAAAGLCRWRRVGPKWIRGCEDPPPPAEERDDRAARRRAERRRRGL